MEKHIENPEKRTAFRLNEKKVITAKDIKTGSVFKAKMLNICAKGFYFETDKFLRPDAKISICEKEMPNALLPEIHECSGAIILWRKELKASYFNYGYGVELIFENREAVWEKSEFPERKRLRKHKRRSFNKQISFVTHDGVSEGISKNISPSGIQLESKKNIQVGQIIYLTLPLTDNNELKVEGIVVWVDGGRFGVRYMLVKKKTGYRKITEKAS